MTKVRMLFCHPVYLLCLVDAVRALASSFEDKYAFIRVYIRNQTLVLETFNQKLFSLPLAVCTALSKCLPQPIDFLWPLAATNPVTHRCLPSPVTTSHHHNHMVRVASEMPPPCFDLRFPNSTYRLPYRTRRATQAYEVVHEISAR